MVCDFPRACGTAPGASPRHRLRDTLRTYLDAHPDEYARRRGERPHGPDEGKMREMMQQRHQLMEQIEGVGSHLVWATYQGTVTSGVSRLRDDQITEGDAKALAARTDL